MSVTKIVLIVFVTCSCGNGLKLASLEKTYQWGLNAYSGERWSKCIEYFEESLHLYKLYRAVVQNCRHKCNTPEYVSKIKEDIEDLTIFEKYINRRNCLIKCNAEDFENMKIDKQVSESVLLNLQTRKPYSYLQLCYFQMYDLPKAANAANTYLAAHPNDKIMQNNLEYYKKQPEVNVNEIVDVQSNDYQVLHDLGIKSYKQKNWAETIGNMEEVITDYLNFENDCRVECEHRPEQEQSSEFSVTLSNYIASLLYCRQQCQDKLKSLKYDSGIEFLADTLNYLQISYYYLERYDDAAKSVASYLTLLPKDEDMLENKKIYSTLINPTSFIERSDIVYYFKRDHYEKELLNTFLQGSNNIIESNSI